LTIDGSISNINILFF